MAILIKQIKPKRFDNAAFRQIMEAEMKQVGKEIKADFEKTTKTWEHKPEFEVITELKPAGPTILVDTDDEIYRYVSEGTEAHAIFAGIYTGRSKKKALAFPAKSSPKTKPGSLTSGSGFKSKAKIIRPYVWHPGIKPRKFQEGIQKLWTKKFKRRMEAAMSKAIRKSGYGVSG